MEAAKESFAQRHAFRAAKVHIFYIIRNLYSPSTQTFNVF